MRNYPLKLVKSKISKGKIELQKIRQERIGVVLNGVLWYTDPVY